MKKTGLNLVTIFLSALLLTSCDPTSKMVQNAANVKYTVTPSPLEMHAGKVSLKISGSFPEKYFNKKAVLTLTPVLKYEGGEVALTPYVVQGEAVEANYQVIKNVEGGKFESSLTFDYKEEYMKSELYYRAQITVGKKSVTLPDTKIADGILSTSNLAGNTGKVILAQDKFQRITAESKGADIKYAIQQSNIRPAELSKDQVKELEAFLQQAAKSQNITLKNVEVNSFASPDGEEVLNEKISKGRKTASESYVTGKVKKAGFANAKEASVYNTKYTSEDWDGFKKLVENSNIQDKELILRVLSMYSDPAVREKEIKNMAATFEVLKEQILPALRRSEFVVNIEVVGKSDEEITAMVDSNAAGLNNEEILYAATLTQDLNKKLAIYQKASELYATDWRTFNNVGYMQFVLGNVAAAKDAFTQAKAVQENDIVNNNLGVIAIKEGNLDAAITILEAAMGAGQTVNFNLGLVKLIQGDYDAAVNYFGNACDNQASLALLMKNNNDGALKSVECITDGDALTFYLKAIIGARNQNETLLWQNLRTAVAKDATFKVRAAKDLEFRAYFENDNFKEIVK